MCWPRTAGGPERVARNPIFRLSACAAARLSGEIEEGVIVCVFPDSGFKYLSKVYNDDWLEAQRAKAAGA